MKAKNLIIIIALLILGVENINAQTDIFDKLANDKNITTVFISKALLGMAPMNNMSGLNIQNLTNKLDQLEIYTGKLSSATKLMRTQMKSLIDSKTHELLMSVKDENGTVTFYTQKEKDKFKSLIMFVDNTNECIIIQLLGTFSAEDIKNVVRY